jgi:hypothetical protein
VQANMPTTLERLIAPKEKYRVIGVDTVGSEATDYLIGDYGDAEEAKKVAAEHGGVMNPVYVYDDHGKMLFRSGTP